MLSHSPSIILSSSSLLFFIVNNFFTNENYLRNSRTLKIIILIVKLEDTDPILDKKIYLFDVILFYASYYEFRNQP